MEVRQRFKASFEQFVSLLCRNDSIQRRPAARLSWFDRATQGEHHAQFESSWQAPNLNPVPLRWLRQRGLAKRPHYFPLHRPSAGSAFATVKSPTSLWLHRPGLRKAVVPWALVAANGNAIAKTWTEKAGVFAR